jgi:phage terminase large subunit-like protein
MFYQTKYLGSFWIYRQPNHHPTLTWHSEGIKATHRTSNLIIFIFPPSSLSYGGVA